MGWKETDKMDEKKEFIFRCWNREETFTEICRKFGISTKTGYKWRQALPNFHVRRNTMRIR